MAGDLYFGGIVVGMTIGNAHVLRFRAAIERKLGLNFEDDKQDFLAEVLRARLEKADEAGDIYLARLETQLPSAEWGVLGELLTVPETYFFRHYDQFRAFAEVALPDRIRAQSISRRLSILSAGCASGEEAYSLAVLTREATDHMAWDISIVGIDINPAIIKKAVEARYSTRALRQTSTEMQHKLFGQQQQQDYALNETIRSAVRFEERNLAEDDPSFWRPESFDIIFCRNVIIYFSAEQAQALVRRFARALAPGGYLFLGHAENLRGLSQDFHVCHTHETFYYRRRSSDETVRKQPAATPALPQIPSPLEDVLDGNVSWVEAIRTSAERIQSLAEKPASANNSMPNKSRWSLNPVFDLLRNERFHEALNAVRELPAEAANDADAVLLQAVLCAHSGKLDEAEKVCRHLLDIDELNAGAQYVLALCCEGAGDNSAAVTHDQTAIYLDPGFAMPHLHLGLLARRGNDFETAQRELQQALILFQREELSRLLLFGGGFGREALLALCRAELIACGGRL